jgi:hypothetical protein
MQEQSKAFAARLQTGCKARDRSCEIKLAWRLAYSRYPSPAESKLALNFLTNGGNLQEMCLAILNRNELIYVQ